MTHLLDTSSFLAPYLGEHGAKRVQSLLEDEAVETRHPSLCCMSLICPAPTRCGCRPTCHGTQSLPNLANEIVDVNETVRREAILLRTSATALRLGKLLHYDPR